MKYILFPLGNNGEKYKNTRHNVARILIDKLKNREDFNIFLEQNNIEVFIPTKYFMNESGIALKQELKNKNINLENVIIIYDDKDIEIGNIKISQNNSDGGHNGIKNIIQNFGKNSWKRIRIGIAEKGTGKEGKIPLHGEVVADYVLDNFNDEELFIFNQDIFIKNLFDKIKELIK